MIPRLRTLCFGGNRFGVPPEFAGKYVKIHTYPGRDGWATAEEHWEQVVDRVFNTDAVKPDAQGDMATEQAVAAAVKLLDMFAKRGRARSVLPQPRLRRESMAGGSACDVLVPATAPPKLPRALH